MKQLLATLIMLTLFFSLFWIFVPQAKAVSLPPVAYWKFDEGSGTVVSDSSGNGNTGTLMNGPQWVDGKVGKALKFDGVDDYVYFPHSSSLDITGNQMTVEYWMKLAIDWYAGMSTNWDIYDKGDAYVGSMTGSTGAHRFNLPYKPQYPETNKNSWAVDTWYHMADVYDGAYIRLYVNGVLDKAEPVTGPISHSTHNFAIGAQCIQAWPYYFNGTIDEFAIYDYARTAEEIWSDYSGGGAPPLPEYTLKVYSSPTGVTFTVDGISRTTPWSVTYNEGTSVGLVMPQTHDGYVWFHWLEDGDPNRIKTVTMDTNITLTGVFTLVIPSPPVGGKIIPIDIPMIKPESQTPWAWLPTVMLLSVLTVVCFRIRKRHRDCP